MARATRVYIVLSHIGMRTVPVVGFTVRHELESWCSKHTGCNFSVWSLGDDDDTAPIHDITAEMPWRAA